MYYGTVLETTLFIGLVISVLAIKPFKNLLLTSIISRKRTARPKHGIINMYAFLSLAHATRKTKGKDQVFFFRRRGAVDVCKVLIHDFDGKK